MPENITVINVELDAIMIFAANHGREEDFCELKGWKAAEYDARVRWLLRQGADYIEKVVAFVRVLDGEGGEDES